MEFYKHKTKIRKIIFFLLITIIIFQIFKLPYNFYYVYNRDYHSRMNISHGYCDKDSYGFINETLNQFKIFESFPLRKIYYPTPGLEGLLKKTNAGFNERFIFILNYAQKEDEDLNDIISKKLKIKNFEVDLSNYNLVKRSGNCFFWIKDE